MTSVFVDLRRGAQMQQTLPVASEEDAQKSFDILAGDQTELLFHRDDTPCWVQVGGGPVAFVVTYADESGLSHVPVPRHPGTQPVTFLVGPSNAEVACPADQVLSREEAELVVAEFARTGERTPLLDWWEVD